MPSENAHDANSGKSALLRDGNRILTAVPDEVRYRLAPMLDRVEIRAKQTLSRRGEPSAHVYFPIDALASILSLVEDGRLVEVGAVGRQGFVGLPVLFGDNAPAFEVIGQVPGEAWRMPANTFRAEAERAGPLRHLLLRFAQAQMVQTGQTAACNRLHEIDLRTSRWLLHTADWVGRERFELTQEFLAYMLGVRRPSVTTAAAMLQRAGFITYRRGTIEIVDRFGLEAATCECYTIIRDEYRRLLDVTATDTPRGNGYG